MIISGGSRSQWRFFARHLTNEKDNERVRLIEIRGLSADNVQDALREMDAVASGTRASNFFYHADINPRADERLTPEQWERSVDLLESNLRLEGQPRFVIEHEKEGRQHRHVIWSRIDIDSMTVISDWENYARHEITSRALEREFGHEAVRNAVTRQPDEPRPDRRPKDWETFRGKQSGIDPDDVKRVVTALWQASDTGAAFREALEQNGYVLCKGDRRDFCIVDQAGDDHSLARRIDGAKAADIRARLADIDRDALPSVAAGRELQRAKPDDQEPAARAVDSIAAPVIDVKPPEEAEPTRLRHEALEAEMQPYSEMIDRGEEIEPAETWVTRTREFIQRTTRELKGMAATAKRMAKSTWARHVESRRRQEAAQQPASWRQRVEEKAEEQERDEPEFER